MEQNTTKKQITTLRKNKLKAIYKKLKWKLKSLRNWFLIKYKKCYGQQPYIFNIYDNSYIFESKKTLNNMLQEEIGKNDEPYNLDEIKTRRKIATIKWRYKINP